MATSDSTSTPAHKPPPRWLPAVPYFHFMAFAPLDAWARLIIDSRTGGGIGFRYWPRVVLALATSAMGTVLTLPERLLCAVALRGKRAEPPPSLFVLGYYRSGTTHLHYLLSCDPQVVTPRWYQMLAPQGFALSWTLLRFLLVPFLSSTRPQDDVAYGPEYPAEDDFGVCNFSGIGTMPGRMILPSCWEHYKRFHTLDGLGDAELSRFRRAQMAITARLRALNPGRILLLKTPAHTARLAELVRLYGPKARFIHLHREPTSVLRSNVAMHRRFEPFLLQDHPGDAVVRARVVDEYDRTERAFLRDVEALPAQGAGIVARVRYEDLIADPVGELNRAYRKLGLGMSPAYATRLVGYLKSVESYRAADAKAGKGEKGDGREAVAPADELSWMHTAFGHDRPAIPKVEPVAGVKELIADWAPPADATLASKPAHARGVFVAACVAIVLTAAWLGVAAVTYNRHDWLIWPIGVLTGIGALKAAKRGSFPLGLITGLIVLAAFLVRAWPATYLSEVRYHTPSPDRWHHVWLSTRDGVLTFKNIVWLVLGAMSAARFASREHVRPPGM